MATKRKKPPALVPSDPQIEGLPSSRRIAFSLSNNEETLLAEISEPFTVSWSDDRHQTVRKLALYGAWRLLMESDDVDVFAEFKRGVSCMNSLTEAKKGAARNERIRHMRIAYDVQRESL